VNDTVRIEAVEPHRIGDFIEVPYGLYGTLPNWIPPLRFERRMAMKPGASAYLRRAETAFWIARRGDKAVGRISAQIDPLSLEGHPGIGHFGFIAAEDDAGTFAALLGTAEDWLRQRGMKRVLGPMSFSVNDECGLLVHGFDTPPMVMMPHDPPYAGGYIEAAGYAKTMDLFAYAFDYTFGAPARMNKLIARAKSAGISVRPLEWSRYDEEIRTIVNVHNDAWSENWDFVPITGEEVGQLAKELKPLIIDKLVQFAEMNGETVGFIVCLPNLNEAIRDLNGNLLPFGWAKLLWRIKVAGVRSARVPLMGVRRHLTGNLLAGMIPFLMIGALEPEAKRRKLGKVEVSWILECNPAMRTIAKTLCGEPYKTNRLYEKALA
jgi:hypothetical protein